MSAIHSPHDTGGSGEAGAGASTADGDGGDGRAEETSGLHIAALPPTPLGVVPLAPSYKMHVPVECAQQKVGIVAAAAHSTAQLGMS